MGFLLNDSIKYKDGEVISSGSYLHIGIFHYNKYTETLRMELFYWKSKALKDESLSFQTLPLCKVGSSKFLPDRSVSVFCTQEELDTNATEASYGKLRAWLIANSDLIDGNIVND